jgi:hypothetical protein
LKTATASQLRIATARVSGKSTAPELLKETKPVNREIAPRDKKLEHVEDLERMSRILKRRSEEAQAAKKKELDGPGSGS